MTLKESLKIFAVAYSRLNEIVEIEGVIEAFLLATKSDYDSTGEADFQGGFSDFDKIHLIMRNANGAGVLHYLVASK